MHSNWTTVRLGEIGKFSKGSGASKAELALDGVAAIRYGELYTRHHIKVSKIGSRISNESAASSVQVNYGDILFAGSGETIDEIGKSAVYLGEEECYAGGDVIIFSPSAQHNPLFLAYLLNSPVIRKNLRELGQGQSVVHIYKRDLEQLVVSIPNKQEQSRIVHTLEIWNGYLNELEEKIKLKRDLKKGLIQQLVTGKKRLPGFSGVWTESSLKDITNLIKDGSHGSHKEHTGGIPLLSAKDINGGINFKNNPRLISKADFDAIHRNYRLQDGDLVLTIVGTLGRVAVIKNYDNNFTFQRSVAILRFKNNVDSDFMYYLLSAHGFQHELKKRESKGAQGGVYLGELAKIKLLVPPIQEQLAIAKILSTLDKEITLLDNNRKLVTQQNKYLVNRLVTGKIRLPILEGTASKEARYA